MTYDEIEVGGYISELKYLIYLQAAYPEDFANRDDDKFNYRYRGNLLFQAS